MRVLRLDERGVLVEASFELCIAYGSAYLIADLTEHLACVVKGCIVHCLLFKVRSELLRCHVSETVLLKPLHAGIYIESVSVVPWRINHGTVLYLSVHSSSLCDRLRICQIGYVALSVPSYYKCIQRVCAVEVRHSSYPCKSIRQREADDRSSHYKPQLKCGASSCTHVGRSERDALP